MIKGVLFRLDDNKLIAFDNKLSDKGISKQFFLNKCVELFIEDKLSFDNNLIASDNDSNADIVELKKQMAIVLERLRMIESDSNVITFVDTIIDSSLGNDIINNDSNVIASDNSTINILPSVQDDTTEESTLSECPILPLNEDLRVNTPKVEISPNNNDIQLIETEKDISSIGSLTDAIDNVILPELAKGNNNHSEIARMLQGKYSTSMTNKRTNWTSRNVDLALQYRREDKV
jgi:hypothetical protein